MNSSNLNKRRNKFVSALLVIAMVLPTIPIFTVPAAAASGNWNDAANYNTTVANQTPQNFTITSAAQLAGFAVAVNGGKNYSGFTVTLGGDIEMEAHYWETIGNTTANYFAGTFDGAGHTISNLTYYNHGGQYYGLFGYTNGAKIQNLKFTANMNLTGVSHPSQSEILCGGLVGFASNTKIYDCEFMGSTSSEFYFGVTDTYLAMGGIAGKFENSSEIISCIVNPVVKYTLTGAKTFVGGIVGRLGNYSKIINCTANKVHSFGTNVSSDDNIGGIAGAMYTSCSIDSCKTLQPIKVENCHVNTIYAGGLVGYGYNGVYIRNCAPSSLEVVLKGTVSSQCIYGGIAGFLSDSYVYNNYAAAPCNTSEVLGGIKYIGSAFGNTTSTIKGIFHGSAPCNTLGTGTYTNEVLLSSGVYSSISSGNGVLFSGYASTMLNGGDTDITTAADTNAIPYPITWTGTSTASLSDWVNPGNYDIATAYTTPSNITITTAKQLAGIAAAVRLYGKDYSGCTITLGADIDLSAYPWVAIAVGTFDGAGHTISGLNVDTGFNYFGLLSTATTVKDLTVNGSVDAVTNAGRANNIYVGGIVGKPVTLTNCTSNVNVTYKANYLNTENAYIGSMGGYVSGGAITNCVATGSVTVNSNRYTAVGGLCGTISSTAALDCSAKGAVSVSNQSPIYGTRAGGLFGQALNNSNILNSFSTGAVATLGDKTNAWSVGGFIGNLNSNSTIKNCYSTGAVTGSLYTGITGGFIGAQENSSTTINSYCFGAVTANVTTSGGIVGYSNGSTLTDCYWMQNGSYTSASKYTGNSDFTNTMINNVTMLTATQMANESVLASTSVGTSTYTGKYFLPALNAAAASITNAKNWYDVGSFAALGAYAATVNVYTNGSVSSAAVTSSLDLYNGNTFSSKLLSDSSNGVYTGYVLPGTYNIYIDGIDTNVDITITTSGSIASVYMYSVNFSSTYTAPATGSMIAATAGGSAISNGAFVAKGKEVIITASGTGASFYTYSWINTPTGGVSNGDKLTVSQISTAINVSSSVLGINAPYVFVKLDGEGSVSPVTSGAYLKDINSMQYTLSLVNGSTNGLYTANVVEGKYDVYINGADTGVDLAVSAGVGGATINYYTVVYTVANAGTATGSAISATASGSSISSGAYVLSGKPVIITASGAGANSYAYAWAGTTGGGTTSAGALSISSLTSTVNATCTVTGINAIVVTINLDRTASASPATSGVALYLGTTKTTDMAISAAGIYTARVADATYDVYVNGADTGIDLVVSGGVGSAAVNYYTVAYTVANAGSASGSTIAATAGGNAITSGTYVLSGKPVVITAVGAGANSYTYVWTGTTGGGTTSAGVLSISSLNSAVNAICTVTGTTANISGGSSSEIKESNSIIIKIVVSADKVFGLKVPMSRTSNKDGQKAAVVEINDAAVADKIKEYTETYSNCSINIDLGQVDAFSAMFAFETIKDLNNTKTKLNFSSQNTSYSLIASAINSNDIMAKFNSNVKESDVMVKITVSKASSSETEAVKNIVERNGYETVINPVSFSIEATDTNSTYEIIKLSKYATRFIKVPSGINSADIATAVVVEDDGSIRHVPTKITNINGIKYVEINSLSNSIYALIKNSQTFSDTTDHWAANEIHDMASRTAVSGVGENVFEPDRSINRAEFAALVVKGLGMALDEYSGTFEDVASIDWYSRYIQTAYKYGIINGNEDGTFNPNAQITREQAFAMISRAMSITDLTYVLTDSEVEEILAQLSDNSNISSYFSRDVAVCIKNNLVKGRNTGEIAPKDRITRAEAMVILRRLLVNSNLI